MDNSLVESSKIYTLIGRIRAGHSILILEAEESFLSFPLLRFFLSFFKATLSMITSQIDLASKKHICRNLTCLTSFLSVPALDECFAHK